MAEMNKTANLVEEIQQSNAKGQERLYCFICGAILDKRRRIFIEISQGKVVAICNRRKCEEIAHHTKKLF